MGIDHEEFILPQNAFTPGSFMFKINPLSANPTKWSNTCKQFVAKLPTNCLSMFDHFVILAFKGLTMKSLINTLLHEYYAVHGTLINTN